MSASAKQTAGLREVLANPAFIRLWVGQVISSIGDRFTQMALLGLLIGSAHMEAEMSAVTFFSLLPALIFGNIAGVLLDRKSRRGVMVAADVMRALLVAMMAIWIGYSAEQHHVALYTFMFTIGICSAFFMPARLAIVPDIVESRQLQAANALMSGSGTIATLIGTWIAGGVVERIGSRYSFMVNAVTFLLSGLAIYLINVRERHIQSVPFPRRRNLWSDVRDALRYLKYHRLARQAILLSVVLSFMSSFFYVTLISLGVRHFRLGTGGVGFFLALLGFGMVAGSFSAPFFARNFKGARILAIGFVTISVASLTLAGGSAKIAWILLLLLGMANEVIIITLDTLLQRIAPDRYRGKLFGLRSALTTAMFLGPLLVAGVILDMTSPMRVLRVLAALSFFTALTVLVVGERFGYMVFRMVVRGILRVIFQVHIEGVQNLNRRGPFILAGNHTGFLDGPLVIAACRRPVRFLVAQKVFNWPGVGRSVRMAGAIPVKGDARRSAFEEALNRLRRGEVIGIFPEGKLTEDGNIRPFRRGATRLHMESGVPIVPFIIHGGFEAWPARRHLPALRPALRRVIIQFGTPIERHGGTEDTITRELFERIQFMKDAMDRRTHTPDERAFAESILGLMQIKSDRFAAPTALCIQEGRRWREVSYGELSRRSRKVSSWLIEQGILARDRIAILSESRPEWSIALFASIRAGAIVVPLDVKLGMTELTSILSDSQPKVVFVSEHYAETARKLKETIPSLQHVVALEELGNLNPAQTHESRERTLDETALIIYTSGTTGSPKGVQTSFGNLVFQIRNFEALVEMGPDDRFLSILPLNHLLEMTGGLLGVLHTGGTVCYAQSLYPHEILRCMRERKVTAMISVPLFYKTLKNSIEKQVRGLRGAGGLFFRCAWFLAALMPSPEWRRILFYPLHRQFGGRLRALVSGGAPLDVDVAQFFDRLGLPLLQGYGLTETSPVISVNTLRHNRIGSVGLPLPGVEVFIDAKDGQAEGEILTRGPHIMQGYYRRDDLTREVIDADEWFHTGDLGRLDKQGYLYITGRIKNLIVLGGGKKVHPEEVEACLSRGTTIKEVCVLGTDEVCAVVVAADTLVRRHKELPGLVEVEIRKELDRLVKDLATYKRPSRILIYPEDLPKTATRKVKRPLMKTWLQSQEKA